MVADSHDNLWLYGDSSLLANYRIGYTDNDMSIWRFNTSSLQWTWYIVHLPFVSFRSFVLLCTHAAIMSGAINEGVIGMTKFSGL
jgi:hypothetical protein